MITMKQVGERPSPLWSFEEIAAELDCAPADLRMAIDEVRHRHTDRSLIGGFRAIAIDDIERVARQREIKLAKLPEALEGFGSFCLHGDAETALQLPRTMVFDDHMARANVPIISVTALSDAGRDFALKSLRHLAKRKPPAGITGDKVRPWREDQRRGREKAEEVAAVRAARGVRNPRNSRAVNPGYVDAQGYFRGGGGVNTDDAA
jgi:hypothetical protein